MADPNTALVVHPGTLLLAISMFGFILAGLSMSAAKATPDHRPALVAWSKAMVGAGGGFLLYFFRGHASWFLTFVVANIFVVGCAAYGHVAFARLLDFVPRRSVVMSVTAIALSGVLATYESGSAPRLAVFTVSGGVAMLLGMTAALLVVRALEQRTAPLINGAIVTALMSFGFAARALISVFGDAASVSPAANSPAQVAALLMGPVFVVVSSVSFFAVVHEQQRLAILKAASRDGLTGVLTRAAFFDQAGRSQGDAAAKPYAVVMLDIDHFKKINDTYGHAAGDVTLAHAGRLLAGAVRISDLVGRYGGEEFAILLRDCSEEQAATLARRIVEDAGRQRVRLTDGRLLSYTVSAGYAVTGEAGQPPEPLGEVLERADQALFRAKNEGRNRALPAFPRSSEPIPAA